MLRDGTVQLPAQRAHSRTQSPLLMDETARPIAGRVWLLLFFVSLTTFTGFFILDPDPSLLLSGCVAVNAAILGWAMLRLYQLDLLLSPMMLLFVGPTMFMYYTWGNLGARITGEARYIAHFDTLEYYPLTALLSAIGLILYCLVVFGIFRKTLRRPVVRFQDLYWEPGQVLGAMFLVAVIFVYLSLKYSFVSGYFRGAESDFDRWLIATMNSFVTLVAVISVSVLAREGKKRGRMLAFLGVAFSLILSIGLRSRTFMLINLVVMALCWITLKPRQPKLTFFLVLGLGGSAVFGLGTAVKSLQGENTTIAENLSLFSSIDSSGLVTAAARSLDLDRQYRTAGFELPSALLRCQEYGAVPAYGEGMIGALLQGLPSFLRPSGNYTERGNILFHYMRYCFFYGDSISIPLTSGIADWGLPGVSIYILMGIFSVLLWKLTQRSPRLYLAFLFVPLLPDQLFWSTISHYAKFMTFLWIFLWVAGGWCMPRWSPPSDSIPQVNA